MVVVLWGGQGSILSSTSQGASALSFAIFLSHSTLQLETQAHVHIIQQILPIENGIKFSFFQNFPSFRKCSGLKCSGVFHSFLSNIREVKLVDIIVP